MISDVCRVSICISHDHEVLSIAAEYITHFSAIFIRMVSSMANKLCDWPIRFIVQCQPDRTMLDIDFIVLCHIWRTFPVSLVKLISLREWKKTNYQWAPFSRIIWFSKWNMQILYQRYQDCLHRQITFSKLHTFFSLFVLLFGTESIYIQTNSFFLNSLKFVD